MDYDLKDEVDRGQGVKDDYLQVSPTRNIQGNSFPLGAQVYRWAVSENTFWHPRDSYFRIRVSLTQDDGITPVVDADNVALNMAFIAELYQSLTFSINGVIVNRVPDFIAQCDMLDKRSRFGADWLDGFGLSSGLYNPDFAYRQALTSSSTPGSASILEFDWYVPLGIFNCGALPCGDYQLTMLPQTASAIQVRAVQVSPAAGATPYLFSVIDGYFMVRTSVYGSPIQSAQYLLDMTQIVCQAETINPIGGIQQKQFEARESTKALVFALQDQRAGTDPLYSASFFRLYEAPTIPNFSDELLLNRLFIDYGGESKPSPDWTGGVSLVGGLVSNLTSQLYYATYAQTGMIRPYMASPESKAAWQQRGSYYWFNWKKQPGNMSTRVYANAQMSAPIPNNRALLFCVYSTVAQITVNDNHTVEVRVLDV